MKHRSGSSVQRTSEQSDRLQSDSRSRGDTVVSDRQRILTDPSVTVVPSHRSRRRDDTAVSKLHRILTVCSVTVVLSHRSRGDTAVSDR